MELDWRRREGRGLVWAELEGLKVEVVQLDVDIEFVSFFTLDMVQKKKMPGVVTWLIYKYNEMFRDIMSAIVFIRND